MSVRVRFAPSPTGKLHVGNVRTALVNVLFARAHRAKDGGTFVLRFEDTDLARDVPEAEKQMQDDLAWLHMQPDEGPGSLKRGEGGGDFGPYYTRQRHERGDYTKALEKLKADNRVYECFVSKDELELMRKIQRASGKPPHYDGRHRALSEEQKEAFRTQGRKPVLRFRLDEEKTIHFHDLVRADVTFDPKNLGGDPVIVRENGIPLFTFAGVVDDINQKMSHVIRGEDHVSNTAIQVQIFEALGAKLPVFAHLPMLMDKDGTKLSKRLDGLSVKQLREAGYMPQAVVGYLASLGFGHKVQAGFPEDLGEAYDLSGIGRSPVRFDTEQLLRLNASVLREMAFEDISADLAHFVDVSGLSDAQCTAFWEATRENISLLSDVQEHFDICFGELEGIVLPEEDADYIRTAEETLPAGPYTNDTWNAWVNELKSRTQRKGKGLFMPLRVALTGQQHGPELAHLLPVMGENVARARLRSALGGKHAA